MWTRSTDFARERGYGFGGVHPIEILIFVVEQSDARDSQSAGGCSQLPFANPSQLGAARMLRAAGRKTAIASALPAGRGDQVRFDAFARITCQRAAKPERFVVRMRRRHEKPQAVLHADPL